MDELWENRLFRQLWQGKDRLAAWIGCDSLEALACYVRGYVDAIQEPDDFTQRWLEAFAQYLRPVCNVRADRLDVFGVLAYGGYSGAEGLHFFVKQLEQFAQGQVYEELLYPTPPKPESTEIRAFRMDQGKVLELAGDNIMGHVKEVFGVPEDGTYTLCMDAEQDGTVLVALCNGRQTAMDLFAQKDKLQTLPINRSGEKIQWEKF